MHNPFRGKRQRGVSHWPAGLLVALIFAGGANALAAVDDIGAALGLGVCTLTCPANVTADNQPMQCGSVVNYPAPTTEGPCETVTCTPASGSFFQVGTTAITCQEAGGASCMFNVTVNDVEPPAITCPADVTATAPYGSDSIPINYSAPTVGDNCMGLGPPVCLPASGSQFPVGETTATCMVTDAADNTATCSFLITVLQQSVLEVPTLGAWGLALLALALAALAVSRMRRRAGRT